MSVDIAPEIETTEEVEEADKMWRLGRYELALEIIGDLCEVEASSDRVQAMTAMIVARALGTLEIERKPAEPHKAN